MTRVASFDVFDTLLTRVDGSPRQVFVTTGRRLRHAGLVDIDPEAYAAAREEALQDLTPDIGVHPPLQRVAEELASRLGLPPARAAELMATELEVESDVCRAVPGSPERLEQERRDTGRGIVFVSDTSMPEAFLRDLLVREGLFAAGDQLFTSSGHGASKQEGRLFDVVAAELGVEGAQMWHVGDDRWSDLAHARLHGWNATLDTRAHLTSRERSLDRRGVTTAGLGPRLAGASRMGRLQATQEGIDPGIAAIAGSVALPLLAGFGLWVLRQAELLELDRLFFVARDGEVFLEVTRALAEHAGDTIEVGYLHGSRLSWQLAATGTSAYDLDRDLWLPDEASGEALTPQALLALVDLSAAAALELTGRGLFAPDRAQEVLGSDGWAELRGLLSAGPLAAEIRLRAVERRDLLVRYLDEQGVTAPGRRVGLVDVGWTGRAARALEDVLLDAGRPLPAAHLFLGLRGSSPERMGADLHGRSRGWLLDEARGRGVRTDDEDPVMVVESFAMGREGHTTGYTLIDDTVVPQLAAPENAAAVRWGLDAFRRALALALAAFLDGPAPDPSIDLRPLVWRQLLGLWRDPSRTEAVAWGAQPYSEDFANALTHPLATPVTARRMLARLGLGDPGWRQPTYWLAGTIAISPQPWRSVLRAADRAQTARGRLRRIPARLRGERALRRG